jgi:hypothetical protein
MKLKLILGCLLVLIISGKVIADDTSSLALDSDLQSTQETENSTMIWPMLPGENLNDVARLFYPKNVIMQRLFVSKTLHLNKGKHDNLNASKRFDEPTLLEIPTIKSLSKTTQYGQALAKKPRKHRLQITTEIEEVLGSVPAKLREEYEYLVSKNEFLRQQLIILKDKIVFLENKLGNLKLIWEKTLSTNSSVGNSSADSAAKNTAKTESELITSGINNTPDLAVAELNNTALSNTPVVAENNVVGKKSFKNLNTLPAKTLPTIEPVQATNSWVDYLNTDIAKIVLVLGLLGILTVFGLKKYRQNMFAKMSFVATKMQSSIQETMDDFGGYLKPKLPEVETPEAKLQAKAAKEVEARLDSTLAEAKLLMSVNRHQDAIAHVKLTIEAQPKACINHWLYLLEIYRKLNLKDEFEEYAAGLHQIYNVMTPVWYETKVAMVVPQSLEEFPHIMEKLYTIWPGDLASVYLRGLIVDNRGGERVGFGKAVLGEILMLIEMLDIQKDLN